MNNNQYTTVEVTEELLQSSKLSEPLHLAAMLEQTSQSPLHGKAADCLRRMYAEAQPAPVQEPVIPEGVLAAIRNAGLTLLKTQHGYQLQKFGQIEAQTAAPIDENQRLRAELKFNTPPAAPVQEPVADAMARYLRVCSSGGMPKKLRESVQNLVYDAARLGYFKAATPPAAQRQWRGLTDKEFEDIIMSTPNAAVPVMLWQLIQDKLKEKNT